MECIFCSIVEGTASAWKVYEDQAAVAFLDIRPATEGHTLVVSRTHAPDLWSLAEDDAAEVMRAVHRVSRQLRDSLRPDGLNVVQSNGAAAWQDVFHYHVHLVPRYADDGLTPPWSQTSPPDEQLAEVHRTITEAPPAHPSRGRHP